MVILRDFMWISCGFHVDFMGFDGDFKGFPMDSMVIFKGFHVDFLWISCGFHGI